jgi:hypothetical protein
VYCASSGERQFIKQLRACFDWQVPVRVRSEELTVVDWVFSIAVGCFVACCAAVAIRDGSTCARRQDLICGTVLRCAVLRSALMWCVVFCRQVLADIVKDPNMVLSSRVSALQNVSVRPRARQSQVVIIKACSRPGTCVVVVSGMLCTCRSNCFSITVLLLLYVFCRPFTSCATRRNPGEAGEGAGALLASQAH